MKQTLEIIRAEIDRDPGQFSGELALQTTRKQLPALGDLLTKYNELVMSLNLSGSQISVNQRERDRDEALDRPQVQDKEVITQLCKQFKQLTYLSDLDLSRCNLSSQDVATIIANLPHGIRRLSLAHISCGGLASQALVQWIGNARQLCELDLRSTLRNEADLRAVLSALTGPRLPLQRLDIRGIVIAQAATVQTLRNLVDQTSLIELQLDDQQLAYINQWESDVGLDVSQRWPALREVTDKRAQTHQEDIARLATTNSLINEVKHCLDYDNHKWLTILIHMKGSVETTIEPMSRMHYRQMKLQQLYESERSLLVKYRRVIAAHLSNIDKFNPRMFSEEERNDLQLNAHRDDVARLLESEGSPADDPSPLASLFRQLLTEFDREADESFVCESKDEIVPSYALLAESLQQWFDEEVGKTTETIREQVDRISTAPVMDEGDETWRRITTPALKQTVSAQLTGEVVKHLSLLSSYTDQTMTVAKLCDAFQRMKKRIVELGNLIEDMTSRSSTLDEGRTAIGSNTHTLERLLNNGFIAGDLPRQYRAHFEDLKPLLLKAESAVYTEHDFDVLMKYKARVSGESASGNRIKYLSPSLLLQEAYAGGKVGCMRVLLDAGADVFYVDESVSGRYSPSRSTSVFEQALSEKGRPTKCTELVLERVYQNWDRLFDRYQEGSLSQLKENLNTLKEHLDNHLKTIKSRHYSPALRQFFVRIFSIGMPHKGEVKDYYKKLSKVTAHKSVDVTLDMLSAIYKLSQEAKAYWKNNTSFHIQVGKVALEAIQLLENKEEVEQYTQWVSHVNRGEELSVKHASLMAVVIEGVRRDLSTETEDLSKQALLEENARLEAQVQRQSEERAIDRARADAEAAARAALEVENRQLKARLAQTSQQTPHPDSDAAPIDAENPSGDQRRILVSRIDDLKQRLRELPDNAQAFGTASGFAGMNLETATIQDLQDYIQMLEAQLADHTVAEVELYAVAGNPHGLYGGVESEEEQEEQEEQEEEYQEAYEEEQEAGEYPDLLQRRFGPAS